MSLEQIFDVLSIQEQIKEGVKHQENGTRTGFNNGKWYSYNDGDDTIGYGHLLEGEDFSEGLTEQEVDDLFEQDWEKHAEIAKTDYENAGYDWNDSNEVARFIAIDIAFNVGNLRSFPSFMKAMSESNWDVMVAQCSTNRPPLPVRNEFRKKFLRLGASL